MFSHICKKVRRNIPAYKFMLMTKPGWLQRSKRPPALGKATISVMHRFAVGCIMEVCPYNAKYERPRSAKERFLGSGGVSDLVERYVFTSALFRVCDNTHSLASSTQMSRDR